VSELVRLDGYIPVRVGEAQGLCQALSLEELAVDLPLDWSGEGRLRVTLMCSDALKVVLIAEPEVEPLEGGPVGTARRLLRIVRFEGSGEHDLTGHVSSLRKSSHLAIAADEDVESACTSPGWDGWRLPNCSLPEAHPDELDLSVELLGKRLSAPVMIAGMTGGSERAGRVNRRLAAVAQELGLAMGLGSQRAMLEIPALRPTFAVRDVAPDILLVGNVGAVQLNRGVTVDDCRRLVEMVEADALALHLNALQELVQPEGDRDWRGLLGRIEEVARALPVPVVAKEVGGGVDPATARRLRDAGVAAIDVGGAGGTAWGWVEGFRAASPGRRAIGATFREWGTPTTEALASCRAALGPDFPLIATGGVRNGLQVAVALALGADVAGMALPFFRAADAGEADALALGRRIVEELRIAVFCSGAGSRGGLRGLATRKGPHESWTR
jgi:isopentenyl-diphosphate Delta-isomerase